MKTKAPLSNSRKPKQKSALAIAGDSPPAAGGELHQIAGGAHPPLTTNQGVAISDNQNSLRANPRGPALLEDFILRDKITHFDHERIPERIVHARGTGMHGFFELTASLKQYTTARVLTEVGGRTPVFTRISTVAGGAGSVDTPRDVRGFSVTFYTKEANWDLVGNNIPVFFIQDAIKFPDLVHAVTMEPDRGFPQSSTGHDTFWDFISLTPESMHMVMWIMSDRTLPRSLRMIEGFGVHSYRLINAAGASIFVKFHWRPKLGLQSTIWDETVKLSGADQDFHRRDMFEAIEAGHFPEWEFAVQLFTEAEANRFAFDHLDATKLIPEELVPLKVIGRMVLDRWPNNFFADTEQVAYCPSHVVPGIDFSNYPLLQGRLFSYQARQFYVSQSSCEQAHIASALVFELSKVAHPHIREAMVGHLRHIEEDLAKRVATGLALEELPDAPKAAAPVRQMKPSPALQLIGKMKDTLLGRAVGILIADGSDGAVIHKIKHTATDAGATVKIIAPKVGGATLADGSVLAADAQLAGTPSVVFDAVAVLLSDEGAKALSNESAAMDFVRDAFGHLKAIAVDEGGRALLKIATVRPDAGVVNANDPVAFLAAAKTRQWDREKSVRTLA